MGNGEWQCVHGNWHDAGEKCDCENEKGSAPADQSEAEPKHT